MNISKESFVDALESVRKCSDYQDGLNDYFRKNHVDGYIYQPDCMSTVVELLHIMCGDFDKHNWIEYFCFETDFGREYYPIEVDGREIVLKTAGDLYDFLAGNIK